MGDTADIGLTLTMVNPTSRITAITVQDLATGKTYTWQSGFWGPVGQPKITAGPNLYISATATNKDAVPYSTSIQIKSVDTILNSKSETVPANGTITVEYTGNMPEGTIPISIITPDDEVGFDVTNPDGPTPPPNEIWPLILAGVIGGGAIVIAASKKKKGN